MKIIIQRVNFAKIFVNNEFKGEIQKGIVAYVGVANGDCEKDIDFLQKLKDTNIRFETGEFGQYMRIVSENDGPVNLILSSDL